MTTASKPASVAARPPRKLGSPKAFFTSIRPLFGTMTTEQVTGIKGLLIEMGKERWSIAWVAYGLATAFHETGAAMQPVRESPRASEAWRKKNLRYWPWYGRGYPQTTWETNYRKMDKRLGLNGTLIANPDRMLEHQIAALAMVYGMAEGLFSGRRLGTYLPAELGTKAQFVKARPIINSNDQDELVAGYAMSFQAALVAGGWA